MEKRGKDVPKGGGGVPGDPAGSRQVERESVSSRWEVECQAFGAIVGRVREMFGGAMEICRRTGEVTARREGGIPGNTGV